ncbi:MAG TPA: sulfite exporter TauE/SafE family protein [Actinomycetota bacterium]|nr:sulfite exporter TauE/SafE family protein [Actinomycetota bacterium]
MGHDAAIRQETTANGGRLPATVGVGILAGGLSGLFGVGGGILIVPGLVLLLRMKQRVAHATSLAAIIPIAASAVAGYALEGSIDWPAAAWLASGAAVGAVIGARALQRLSDRTLRQAFGGFLLLSALALLLHISDGAGRGGDLGLALAAGLVAAGLISGVLAGLLGVGGGIIIVPALILLFAFPNAVAKGTSLVVIMPTAIAGTLHNVRKGVADLRTAAWVGLGGVAAAFAASLVSVRLDPRVSSVLFAVLLVAVASRLLARRPS